VSVGERVSGNCVVRVGKGGGCVRLCVGGVIGYDNRRVGEVCVCGRAGGGGGKVCVLARGCVSIRKSVCVSVCVRVYVRFYVCVCVCLHSYHGLIVCGVCVGVCVCTHTHINTRTYTRTHTHIPKF